VMLAGEFRSAAVGAGLRSDGLPRDLEESVVEVRRGVGRSRDPLRSSPSLTWAAIELSS
jgi:hypothetical protein